MKRNIKLQTSIIIGFIFTVLMAVSVFGQTQRKQSDNKADQTLRSNGRVNPSTLGLEMDVPLGAYPGRGINIPINLSYSSKAWRMKLTGLRPKPNNSEEPCFSLYRAQYAENSAAGWTSSLGIAYVEYTGQDTRYDGNGNAFVSGCANEGTTNNSYIKRVQIHLPSGESHELRASDTPIFYPSNNSSGTNDTTGIYYSVDGSKLKYVEDGAGNYRLYLPDGSYYDFVGTTTTLNSKTIRKASVYKTLDGNQLTFNEADATYPNGYWVDTLNRIIPVPLALTAPTTPALQNYQLPGIANPYKFTWKQLKGATASESGLTDFNLTLKYRGDYTPVNGIPVRAANTVLFHSDSSGKATTSTSDTVFNPVVLTEIELPNGLKYKFSYNIYGEIDKIYYPTGGDERLILNTVPAISDWGSDLPNQEANRGVTSRSVYENANATPSIWTYSTTGSFKITTNAPDGTKNERYLIVSPNLGGEPLGSWGFDEILAGMPHEERSYASSGQLMSKKLTTWTKTAFQYGSSGYTRNWHPRVTKEETIVYDLAGNALSASSTMEYDGDLNLIDNPVNVKKVSTYGFTTSLGNLGALQNTQETTYLNNPTYTNLNLRGLPATSMVKDAGGNIVSQSQIYYDEAGYGAGGLGKATTSRSWLNTNNSWIETHAKFNSFGNLIETTDVRGNKSQIEYDTTFNAYPVKTRTAIPDPSGNNGSSVAFETTMTYDTLTGLPLTTTDANGQVTTMQYNDPLLRPTRVIPPNGGAISEMTYNDTPGAMWVKTRTQIDGTNWKEAIAYADGLGRTIKTQSIDNQGDVFSETVYDNMGRAYLSSNPYRTGETKYWTQTNFDVAGRVKEVVTPDGAKVQMSYDVSTSGLLGTVTTVTDQANKQRRSITNALGQLMRVDEPDDSGNLGIYSSPTQPTFYSYDTLNNLVQVNQGVQQRNFSYNSLSRLLTATNPESGTINYGYDASGNLTNKTDARGVVTNYVYDNLNRVVNRNYSDGTPAVTYKYDNQTFAKGKLIQVASAISTTNYNSFDNLGRILASQQITDGQTYNFAYSYNLAGALVNETYPSGRIITNQFEIDGDLAQVNGSFQGNNKTYVGSFNYTSAGVVGSMQLGNGKWENTVFNSRLQPIQIGLGNSQTTQDLWKVNYDYGTTDNNGNVKGQTITVPSQFTANQVYTYDSLNRLKQATETISGSQTWKQTFTFDRYGNRKFDASQTTTLGGCPVNVCNPDISVNNNRVVGHSFDNSGNTTQDAEGKTFFYDAENKQKEVRNASNQIIGQYLYDGDGKRVKKIAANDTTIFVYDAGGKLASEYLITASQSQAPTTSYLTNDTLGSPRVTTDSVGNVVSRRDFRPYGEEIYRAGQGTDKVRQKFTSYERDNETNLDYAINRYHSAGLGRFTQVDPYNIIFEKEKGGNDKEKHQIFVIYISQPQIWNKYVYSVNNPLKFTDPDGRRPITEQEKKNIQNFIQSGIDYANSTITDAKEREKFIGQVRNAATVIENAILAVSNDAKEDPKNLRAVLFAIGKIGDTGFNSDGTKYIDSNGATVTFGPGTNKCNLFVAAAYVLRDGANIGFNNKKPGGYQINSGWRNYHVTVANDMVTSGMANFEANSSPQLGDIAAGRGTLVREGYFSNTYNTGHTGIVIAGEVVVSANPSHGVRVGRFSPTSDQNSGFTYLRYKP